MQLEADSWIARCLYSVGPSRPVMMPISEIGLVRLLDDKYLGMSDGVRNESPND